MSEQLPQFRYFPEPVKTDVIVVDADAVCPCCERARGYRYTGPFYTVDEVDGLCPWCIADGSAHDRFDGSFVADIAWGYPVQHVPDAVVDEVTHRTPGFRAWQEPRWWAHCDDAAVYLGPAGAAELAELSVDDVECIRLTADYRADDWERIRPALRADGDAALVLFRCRRCAQYGGYVDLS
ncbi:CbrC family protein [Gordonia sp. TBRC 11910]|uniref:CbrC family protein n=1 Tax=Gordonia asplenii TaxID=2725283 RepID=A0A848KVB9_9ACTN|nr:CbrC family protein [Gordonia asplenii]NMO02490.1 CbrC family protein [Gordonia asplenii]